MTDDEKGALEKFREDIDMSKFDSEPYARRVEKPWGYEIHFTPADLPYMGKILHLDEGKRMSLQIHDLKQETFFLYEGEMILVLENQEGGMDEMIMQAGKGYVVQLGQKHRLKGGKGGGSVVETSTPESGNTYRLQDDYNRSTETEAARDERDQQATNA